MAEIGSTQPPTAPWPIRPVNERREPPKRQPEKDEKDRDRARKQDDDDDKPHIDEYA